MTTPISIREPPSTRGGSGGWTRERIVFLTVSGTVVTALLVWASEVLLPFILALIIAYVLAPLVERVEHWRVPRAAAIILVYVLTLGSIYLLIAAIAPRIYLETAKFMREAPTLAEQFSTRHGPKLEQFRNRLRRPHDGELL